MTANELRSRLHSPNRNVTAVSLAPYSKVVTFGHLHVQEHISQYNTQQLFSDGLLTC